MRGQRWSSQMVTGGEDARVEFPGGGLVMFITGETGLLDKTDLQGVAPLEDGGVEGTGVLESERIGFELRCRLIH